MDVFLSWSGPRSKSTAERLADWLPNLIQAVDPWISTDIAKGARWGAEIAGRLEKTKVGIICLNRENLNEAWILFEAGALSKTKDAHVCTFLLDITHADIDGPLAQFQHTRFEKDDVRKLVRTIYETAKIAGEKVPQEKHLDQLFEKLWPDLERELYAVAEQPTEPRTPVRESRAIIEEILEVVRHLQAGLMPSRGQRGELADLVYPPGIAPTGAFRQLRPLEMRFSDIVADAISEAVRRPDLHPAILEALIEASLKRALEPGPETEPEKKK